MDELSDPSTLSDGPIRNRAAKLLSDLEIESGQRNIIGRSCPTCGGVIGPFFSGIGPNNENRYGHRIDHDIIGMMPCGTTMWRKRHNILGRSNKTSILSPISAFFPMLQCGIRVATLYRVACYVASEKSYGPFFGVSEMTETTVSEIKAQSAKITPKMSETEFGAIAAQFASTDARMWSMLGKSTDAELREKLESALAVRALLNIVATDVRAVSYTPPTRWGFDGASCASIVKTILGSASKSIYGKLLRAVK